MQVPDFGRGSESKGVRPLQREIEHSVALKILG